MNRIPSLLRTLMLVSAMGLSAFAQSASQSMDEILGHYQKIQQSLAADSLSGVTSEAQAIVQKAEALQKQKVSIKGKDPAEFKKIVAEVRQSAGKLDTPNIQKARSAFDELSRPLVRYVNEYEAGKGKYYVAQCPMLNKSWVQKDKKIANPYYGQSMRACGTLMTP